MKEPGEQNKTEILARIGAAVEKHNSFVVLSHEEPDGDAIGSQVAVALALRKLGKSAAALRLDGFPPALGFLNRDGVLETYRPERDRERIAGAEVVFVVDSCGYFRLGDLGPLVRESRALTINLDHHRDNEMFGDINFVRFQAGGAAELVFEVIRALGVPVEGAIAEAIYVGLFTDTVGFKYIDPDGNLIGVVAELVKGGIDIEVLQERLYYDKPDSYLRDLAGIYRRVAYENGGSLVWFTMPASPCLSYYERELASIAIQQLLSMKRIRAAAMLHREHGGVEVWLRSKSDCDVGRAAERLGGGGHKTASGVLLRETGMDDAVRRVLAEVKAELAGAE